MLIPIYNCVHATVWILETRLGLHGLLLRYRFISLYEQPVSLRSTFILLLLV